MKPFRILLVEDNPGDAYLIREIIEESVANVDVQSVPDGAEALAFLSRRPPYAAAETPNLIFLDLNLPKLDGRTVLAEIKASDSPSRRIPVVVLTSSDAEQDIVRAHELGANCYVTKPLGIDAFQGAVRALQRFWMEVAKVP